MIKSEPPTISEHTFKYNKCFIPALLFKYPWKMKFVGAVETTVTSFKIKNKKIYLEKLKKSIKNNYGKEKFIFDFFNKEVKYFENDFSKIHFQTILYDFKEKVHYIKKTWKNQKYKYFYKFTEYYGNNRMDYLMKKLSKDKKIEELVNIDLDFVFK